MNPLFITVSDYNYFYEMLVFCYYSFIKQVLQLNISTR